MLSDVLAKSSTKVSFLNGQVLFNLDNVWTALTPFNFLSTNIECNNGSS